MSEHSFSSHVAEVAYAIGAQAMRAQGATLGQSSDPVRTMRAGLAWPLYVSRAQPNTCSDTQARAICRRHGLRLSDMRGNLEQANSYAQDRITRAFTASTDEDNARLTRDHLNRYVCAAYLFEHYCRDVSYTMRAEAQADRRFVDMAYGSD